MILHDGGLPAARLLEEILGIQRLLFSEIGRCAIDHLEGQLRFQSGAGAEFQLRIIRRISRGIARRPTLGTRRL